MKFTIIGAGMAGLLAGAILRDEAGGIIERQSELPNNHSALLRFRSSIVGDAVNIPFTKVKVMKAVVGSTGNPVGDAIAYSIKSNGTGSLRSSISASGAIEERYIAPPDFIKRLSSKVMAPIMFGEDAVDHIRDGDANFPIISTLPMPVLMNMLEYKVMDGWDKKFEYRSGATLQAKLKNVDVCASLYLPAGSTKAYRASITRDRLIIEYASYSDEIADHPIEQRNELYEVLRLFGIPFTFVEGKPEYKAQSYAKIVPIDEKLRRDFIMWASETHNVYSLGRFATWRPGLLLDDVVNDIKVISTIVKSNAYDHKKG